MSSNADKLKKVKLRVTRVEPHSDDLLSIFVDKPQDLRFQAGQYVGVSVPGADGEPLETRQRKETPTDDGVRPTWRDFSIISPPESDELGILSIVNHHLADDPQAKEGERERLTPHFQNIKEGDEIYVQYNSGLDGQAGSIHLNALKPPETTHKKNLFLLCTGTGLAPFLSVIRDKDTWQQYDHVYLVRGASKDSDLAYDDYLKEGIHHDEYMQMLWELYGIEGDLKDRFTYYPTVTRNKDGSRRDARITDQIESGEMFRKLGLNQYHFDPEADRVMLCGGPGLTNDLVDICEFDELPKSTPKQLGGYAFENAFAEQDKEYLNDQKEHRKHSIKHQINKQTDKLFKNPAVGEDAKNNALEAIKAILGEHLDPDVSLKDMAQFKRDLLAGLNRAYPGVEDKFEALTERATELYGVQNPLEPKATRSLSAVADIVVSGPQRRGRVIGE